MESGKSLARSRKANFSSSVTAAVVLLLLAILAMVPLFVHNQLILHVMILLFINAILGVSWNIIGGYAGQVSLGHAAFYGIGAYTSLILLTRFSIPPWYGTWLGVGASLILSLIVGSICFRLRGPYFVLASIAVTEILRICAINLSEITNGAQGILATEIPALKIGDYVVTEFQSKTPFYIMGLGLLLIALAVSWAVYNSKIGYYLQAIREDQDAADSLGINLALYKNLGLALSASLTALAGGFAALYVGFIEPGNVLSVDVSIGIVLTVIIGGIGTIVGPVIGAIVIVSLSEILRSNLIPETLFSLGIVSKESAFGAFLNENIAHAHVLIYGILVVLVILYMPKGVLGYGERLLAKRGSEPR
jgi:branched-chain amino acid transport system permease protein